MPKPARSSASLHRISRHRADAACGHRGRQRAVRSAPRRPCARGPSELGVDLAQVPASGPDGTVTLADVEAAAGQARRRGRQSRCVARAEPWRSTWRGPGARSPTRHCTTRPISTAWVDARGRHSAPDPAIIAGCTAEPALNASFDAGVFGAAAQCAASISGSRSTAPTACSSRCCAMWRDSDAADWRRQIDAMKKGVQERSLAPDELRGATITLSNFGTIAGQHAALIIVPPQVAILGAGRIADQPARSGRGIVDASHAAAVADLRSPRRHRRRGRALSARGDRRSRARPTERGETSWRTCFASPTSSALPGSFIFIGRRWA